MLVGYHNHSAEFKEMEGEKPWDIFFSRVSKDVVMQFDVGKQCTAAVKLFII
jgi:hypothetical protein